MSYVTPRFARPAFGLAALALVASACGSGTSINEVSRPTTPPPVTTTSPSSSVTSSPSIPPPAAEQVLPSVRVIDLADDARVDVASLVPSATPVLVWFWAPH